MHRHADRAALVGDSAGHGLANPPSGISGEFVAEFVVKLVRRTDQPDVAFLDQIQERHAAPDVLLGYTDNQSGISADQVLSGRDAAFDELFQLAAFLRRFILPIVEPILRLLP